LNGEEREQKRDEDANQRQAGEREFLRSGDFWVQSQQLGRPPQVSPGKVAGTLLDFQARRAENSREWVGEMVAPSARVKCVFFGDSKLLRIRPSTKVWSRAVARRALYAKNLP
jgi:hypothetical protein